MLRYLDGRKDITRLLKETGCFIDFEYPELGTSGELLIYKVCAENLLQDSGEWQRYGNDARGMVRHAANIDRDNSPFSVVIDRLTDIVVRLMPKNAPRNRILIAGGQRRDWIFSGVVAKRLGLGHVALYKQHDEHGDVVEMFDPNDDENCMRVRCKHGALSNDYMILVSDVVNTGESCHGHDGRGWAPRLRKRGARISHLVVVADRNRKGVSEMLNGRGITLTSLVGIDIDFLKRVSTQRKTAVAYFKDPDAWARSYLEKYGVISPAMMNAFDPKTNELRRARKFLEKYGNLLRKAGRLANLREIILEEFGYPIEDLLPPDLP